jgi:hypothetical protein
LGLAIDLVITTIFAVAIVTKAVVLDPIPWSVAFVLATIVALARRGGGDGGHAAFEGPSPRREPARRGKPRKRRQAADAIQAGVGEKKRD